MNLPGQHSTSELNKIFSGRQAWIATMHGKERVIAPELKRTLNLSAKVPEFLDTDVYGTFTGKVKRPGDAFSAARLKCNDTLDRYGGDIAIASEGSFGPDPISGFGALNEELVLMVDRKNNREYSGRWISNITNFSGMKLKSKRELNQFLDRVKFPEHAVIMRRSKDDCEEMFIGIQDFNVVSRVYDVFMKEFGSCFIETDMRAHFNPTRMDVIRSATLNLISVLESTCPECNSPGFKVYKRETGLPCKMCLSPTDSTLAHIYKCEFCNHEQRILHPYNKEFEMPQYCQYCNP